MNRTKVILMVGSGESGNCFRLDTNKPLEKVVERLLDLGFEKDPTGPNYLKKGILFIKGDDGKVHSENGCWQAIVRVTDEEVFDFMHDLAANT